MQKAYSSMLHMRIAWRGWNHPLSAALGMTERAAPWGKGPSCAEPFGVRRLARAGSRMRVV